MIISGRLIVHAPVVHQPHAAACESGLAHLAAVDTARTSLAGSVWERKRRRRRIASLISAAAASSAHVVRPPLTTLVPSSQPSQETDSKKHYQLSCAPLCHLLAG